MLRIILLLVLASPAVAADVSFSHDVMPLLSRAGCNSGPCHGNLNGKGGFKLSLRGENPAGDWNALTRDMLARRTDPTRPGESLLLKKPSGQIPHEGGVRFGETSSEYATFRAWIAGGCAFDAPESPTKLTVSPGDRILFAPEDRIALKATAHWPGRTRDVTHLVAFETTKLGIARVKPTGEVLREGFGDEVVIVRYLGHQVAVRLAFVPERPTPDLSPLAGSHPIDAFVRVQLASLKLPPSPAASDEVFVRRAHLDACGILPTPARVRAFLAEESPDKRTKLVDELLARPEFAEFWALKWSDLLRNEERSLDPKGVRSFHHWMRDGFAADKPLNEFAREILQARGSSYANPPANFYRAVRDPYLRAENVAQVFLGVRIACARCHNHPFDRWTTDEYHRFAAVFPRVQYRILVNNRRDEFDKLEFNGEQIVYQARSGELPHPKGGNAMPKLLGSDVPVPDDDRLAALAAWVSAPNNALFAPAQANRIWFHLTGRGLVDPIDDFRATNPPSNPELLAHLAKQFAADGFRVRALVRHVMTSRTYQLASTPTPGNAGDEGHFARAPMRPLEAEQLLDAIAAGLGAKVKFPGYPENVRAGALAAMPSSGRRGNAGGGERFMKVFGKPERLLTCECERAEEAGMMQAFQLMTGRLVHDMIRDPNNRLGRMLSDGVAPDAILDELYLSTLARFPTSSEREKLTAHVAGASDARAAWEDIAWGLVNAKEFLLRR